MTTIRPMQKNEAETVLALWQEACVEAVGYELSADSAKRVLENLRQYADHKSCHCLVAIESKSVVGFVTCCFLDHPVQPGYLGEIEALYIQPSHDRDKIGTELVYQAIIRLKGQGAGVIKTRVDVEEREQLAFWKRLKWSQDTVNYAIYSNVPGDPDLQAVWDSYTT